MTAAAGSLRAARLLTALRLRQQLNQIVSVYRRRTGAAKRSGTARKSRSGWIIGTLVAISLVFGIGNMAFQGVGNVARAARTAELTAELHELQARVAEMRAAQARNGPRAHPAISRRATRPRRLRRRARRPTAAAVRRRWHAL
jgi:hypothetical protein